MVRLESRQSVEGTHRRLHGAIDTFNRQMMIPLTPTACEETKSSGCAGMHGQDEETKKSGLFHALHSARSFIKRFGNWFGSHWLNVYTRTTVSLLEYFETCLIYITTWYCVLCTKWFNVRPSISPATLICHVTI